MEYKHITENWESFDQYISNQSRGLTTGFNDIDIKLMGLPGLTTVMGEPKSCKSTFVMNVALNKAAEGYPVILLDTENGLQRIRKRILCALGGFTEGVFRSGVFQGDEERRYRETKDKLEGLPLFLIETPKMVEQIEELVREIGREYKKHILLIVDTIQNLVLDFKDRRASVDYWVFSFNDLKNKFEGWLTTIIVSEKRRGTYGMADKAAGKESGGIEYKSECVLDLFPSKENENNIVVACDYNRDGDTGIITHLFKPSPYHYKLESTDSVPE